MKKTILAILVSAATAICTIMIYKSIEEPQQVIIQERPAAAYVDYSNDPLFSGQVQRQFLSSSPTNFIEAARVSTPAVVNIKTKLSTNPLFYNRGGQGGSTGSGVIISPDGYIVTNNHVIEGSKAIEITMHNNREYEAELLGTDPQTDLALLKIEEEALPYLLFGNSDSTQVGEWVLAVGNPFDLESTVTAGIVSAKGRNISILDEAYSIESFIQTDAAVNPGNSGGALVNTNGELVGINTAIITKTGKFQGYSFAVPSNLAQKVIRDLKEFGVVQRGILGVQIVNVNSEIAQKNNLDKIEGVFISDILDANSGAAEAGLRPTDIILKVNNVATPTVANLQEIIALHRPGDIVKIQYVRLGKIKNTKVTLKNKNNTTSFVEPIKRDITAEHGFEIRNLSKAELNALKIDHGVQVFSVTSHSPIHKTNMSPGFVITKINEEPISDVEDFYTKFEAAKGLISFEGVYENYGGSYYYEYRKDEY